MPTLEERVAALEAQMAAIENNKYQMSYSGPDMEALLDFLSARKIEAGHIAATVGSSGKSFTAKTTINYDDYAGRPVVFAKLGYVTGGSTTWLREVPAKTTISGIQRGVTSGVGKVAFMAETSDVPTTDTSAAYLFSYIIMEATS